MLNVKFEEVLRQELQEQICIFAGPEVDNTITQVSFAYKNADIIKILKKRG